MDFFICYLSKVLDMSFERIIIVVLVLDKMLVVVRVDRREERRGKRREK